MEQAGFGPAVADWCRADLSSGSGAAYAIAVPSAVSGGRYLVVREDAAAIELARFTGGADLSCYTPGGARNLNRTIERSETIQGRVSPRWTTTVICGFVEDTKAVCWQYAPNQRRFIEVGSWVT
jgi:hypothetical protein